MKITVFSKIIPVFTFFALGASFPVQAQVISTIGDIGLQCGYSGDNGPAVYAQFHSPKGITMDNSGNLYVVDQVNNRIRMIDAFGNVSTFAGNGKKGFSGDGGKAIDAEFNTPTYIIFDKEGNAYIADTWNARVRKIDTAGIITTIAGNGIVGFTSGNNLLATASPLEFPYGLLLDSVGNLFIANGLLVQKVDKAGIISIVVGSGASAYGGDGGLATKAACTGNSSMAFDKKGNLYVSDDAFHVVRKVDLNGIITRFAGTENIDYGAHVATGDGGPAVNARMMAPSDLKFDQEGNLYITDKDDGRIRKVDTAGIISTFAGNGTNVHSGDGSTAADAGLSQPYGLTIDSNDNFYFTETSTFPSPGSNDIRIIFGTDLSNTASQALIYPNPTFDGVTRLIFPSKYADNINIIITNQTGQKVYENTFVTNLPIEVRLEPTGIYALQAKSRHAKWHGEISVVR